MATRDDDQASRARVEALEHKVAALEAENAALRRQRDAPDDQDDRDARGDPSDDEEQDDALAEEESDEEEDDDEDHREAHTRRLTLGFLTTVFVLATAAAGAAYYLGDMTNAATAAVFAGASLVYLIVHGSMIELVPPGRILIVSGRRYPRPDGTEGDYRVVTGGRVLCLPLVETIDVLDCRPRDIDVRVRGAYSQGNEPLDVELRARYRLARLDPVVHHAIERFLGQRAQERDRVAEQTLEGIVRERLAARTLSAIQSDGVRFADEVIDAAEDDLRKLGMELDALTLTRAASSRAAG